MGRLVRAVATQVSDLVARDRLLQYGESFSGARKLYDVLGYEQELEFEDYYRKYDRGGLAGALIDKPVEKTWRHPPDVVDEGREDDDEPTDFEAAVDFLFDELRLLHYLERADKAGTLGRFGVLFLGLQDGAEQTDLDEPPDTAALEPIDPDRGYTDASPPPLTHFGVHTEDSLDGDPVLESDPTSPRHNLPVAYDIEFSSADPTATVTTQTVHWQRVIHVADGLLESEWEGRPALKRVYNRLEDWDKVVGGVAEIAWRHADRKIIFNLDPDMGDIEDEDELSDQVDEIVHDLRSYLQARGMNVETIEGEVADPGGITAVLKEEIAAGRDVPQRVLVGSERGELASSQDEANFLGKVAERQVQHAEPHLLRPTLDRLIDLNVLPEPAGDGYTVEWPNLFELTELERAEQAAQNAQALQRGSPMGDPGSMLDDERILLWLRGEYDQVVEWVREQDDLDESDLPELPGDVPDDRPGDEPPDDGGPPEAPPDGDGETVSLL